MELNKIKNQMSRYLFIAAFFMAFLLSNAMNANLSFSAPQDLEKISDDVAHQFKQLLEYNHQNDLKGESHKNKYVLNYVAGQPFLAATSGVDFIQQHTFNSQTWTFPWPDSDNDGTFDLEADLCDFNINTTGKNLFNIRKYAILFGLPTNALNTLLSSDLSSQSAIVPYMVGTNAEANKTLFLGVEALIENKIKNDLDESALAGANEKIITVSSYYVFKKPWSSQTYQDTRTRTFFIQTATLTQEIFNNYIAYSSAITGMLSTEKFTGTLYKRIKGFVEFFENPISYNTDFDACALDFTHQKSRDVRDCYCSLATSLSKKQFLTNVCLFVDNNHFYSTGGVFLNPNIQPGFNCTTPTTTWLNTIVPEFNTYETNNPGSDGVNWVLQAKIMTPTAANVKIESVLFWFATATELDFRNLSPSERFKLISICRNKFPGGTSGINTDNGVQATMTRRIYETVYNGTFMDVQQVETFLTQLKGETGLVEWLFEKVADNWTTFESDEHQVVAAFNHITTYMNGGQPSLIENYLVDWDNEGVTWKPTPWWWNFAGHYSYENPQIDVNGKCTFTQRYIDGGPVAVYFTDTPWSETDPFKLIPVGGAQDVTWATDCDNGGNGVVGCGKIVWIPAASLVWYLEKLDDGQTFDAFVAAIEVALLAVGVGEFMVIMRVAGAASNVLKARRVLYGFSLAADIADLALPNVTGFVAQATGVDGLRANQIKQQIRKVTGVMAAVGGVGQITDMFIGLAKYRRVAKLVGSETDVQKIMDDVANMLSQYPNYTSKICQKMDITNPAAISKIEGINSIPHRIAVMGAIRQTDDIKNLVNANPSLVDFLKASLADGVVSDIHNLLLNLDDTKYLKLLQDLVDGSMINQFSSNLELLKGWKKCLDARPAGSISKDIEVITRVTNHINTPGFVAKFDIDGTDFYEKILKKYAGRCNACPPPAAGSVAEGLPDMHVFLDALGDFTNKFGFPTKKPGWDDVVKEVSQTASKQDGAYHMFKHLDQYNANAVERFEQNIAQNIGDLDEAAICAGCVYDAKLTDGTYLEYKSWQLTSMQTSVNKAINSPASNNKFFNQFSQYLQSSVANSFEYIFNINKMSEIQVKGEFRKLMAGRAMDVFDASPTYFTGKGFPDYMALESFMSNVNADLTHTVFDFIKVN